MTERTNNPGNADFIEVWNPNTMRYEGRSFNPRSDFDNVMLQKAQAAATSRGRHGYGGFEPLLYDSTQQRRQESKRDTPDF
jgi:hypothetical protein